MKHLYLWSAAVILLSSCKDDSCEKSPSPGMGGNVKVSGYVRHHNAGIPRASVFIEFGATEFPGSDTALYDARTSANTAAYYEFTGLKAGDYYLYSVGFDSAISLPVKGGIPLEICEGAETVGTNIPVTED